MKTSNKSVLSLLENLQQGKITQQQLVSRMGNWYKYKESMCEIGDIESLLRHRLKLEVKSLLNQDSETINGRKNKTIEKQNLEIIELNERFAIIKIKEDGT